MLHMDIANASTKQKGEVEAAENGCEEEGKSTECISHSVVLQCVDILVDCVGQRRFKHSDSTATGKLELS